MAFKSKELMSLSSDKGISHHRIDSAHHEPPLPLIPVCFIPLPTFGNSMEPSRKRKRADTPLPQAAAVDPYAGLFARFADMNVGKTFIYAARAGQRPLPVGTLPAAMEVDPPAGPFGVRHFRAPRASKATQTEVSFSTMFRNPP